MNVIVTWIVVGVGVSLAYSFWQFGRLGNALTTGDFSWMQCEENGKVVDCGDWKRSNARHVDP